MGECQHKSAKCCEGRHSGGLWRASMVVPRGKNLAKQREYTALFTKASDPEGVPLKLHVAERKWSAPASPAGSKLKAGGDPKGAGDPFCHSHNLFLGAHIKWVT